MLAALIAVVGFAGWSWSNYLDERDRHDAARARATRIQSDLAEAASRLDAYEAGLDRASAQFRKERRGRSAMREREVLLRERITVMRNIKQVFVPRDQVTQAKLISGTGRRGAHLIVSWTSSNLRGGAAVWRSTVPATGAVEDTAQWTRIFAIEVDGDRGLAEIDSAGEETVQGTVGQRVSFETGDLTGDGVPEILFGEHSSGTGSATVWRVIDVGGPTVSQIFHRTTSETYIDIARGRLRIDEATYGKGCRSIHGCGRRIVHLRWTGSGWETLRVRRESRP